MPVLIALLTLALSGAQSTTKPNFSGEWRMNASRSDFGLAPMPTSIVRTITHAEPAMTIVETQRADAGEQSTTRKYTNDGSETRFSSNGADVRTSATWQGTDLVVVSTVDAIGITFRDTMSLSADGKTLTSKVRISTPQGDVDITVVFEQQK